MRVSRTVFVSLLFIGQAKATIVRIDAIDQMTHNSEIIAHVVVGEQTQKTGEDGRTIEFTSVEILEGLKGVKTGEVATIYQLGDAGLSDGVRIAGQSKFRLGEELVLFGMKYDDMIVPYAVGLGKFRVLRNTSTTKIVEEIKDLVAVTMSENKIVLQAPTPRMYPTLDQFKSTIRKAIDRPLYALPVGPKAVRKKP